MIRLGLVVYLILLSVIKAEKKEETILINLDKTWSLTIIEGPSQANEIKNK